jgi:glycosyltransferase involved in cell wall biosynthesis
MKVNFFAPVNNLGYGIHSYNTIAAFEDLGHQATLIPPFGQIHRTNGRIEHWIGRREQFDPNAPGVMIFNEEYLTQFTGRPRIGFPVFECEKFTPLQLAGIKSCEYILTPSAWSESVLKENGVRNVRVVNEGYDPEIFEASAISQAESDSQPFTFIHVGKFEERKGTLQVVRCFFEALEREDARLFLHIANPFIHNYDALDDCLAKLGFISTNAGKTFRRMGLSIHFTNPYENVDDLALLYRKADCGIYPTRAEGWGLPILETIATGVPVIAGNWTGQSEYLGCLQKGYPFFIDGFTKEKAKDSIWFNGDRGEWRVPQDGCLIEKIRFAFKTGREYRKTEEWKSSFHDIRDFTWARAAKQLENALKDICGL